MSKPRVGFFDFTGCEGCQLTVLNLEDEFLELLELMEIVEFREMTSEQAVELDIAFVEGSISTRKEIERLEAIRAKSKVLIALGACADTAGVNTLSWFHSPAELRQEVYASDALHLQGDHPQPLERFVRVDGRVPGCPIDGREFLSTLQSLLIGQNPELPTYAVCAECKLAELPCSFDQGVICLGPVTRAGCDALCIQGGDRCRGCRGLVDQPRSGPYYRILEEHGLTEESILAEFRTFNVRGRGKHED